MSSLLQSRSEAAVVQRTAAVPVSPIPDIDKEDKTDPLAVSDYIGDIISYYRRIEPLYRVAPDYMSRQVTLRVCFVQDMCSCTNKLNLLDQLLPMSTCFLTFLWICYSILALFLLQQMAVQMIELCLVKH